MDSFSHNASHASLECEKHCKKYIRKHSLRKTIRILPLDARQMLMFAKNILKAFLLIFCDPLVISSHYNITFAFKH